MGVQTVPNFMAFSAQSFQYTYANSYEFVLMQLFHYEDTGENEIVYQKVNLYKSVNLSSFLYHHFCVMISL